MEIQDQFLKDFGTPRSVSAIRTAFYRACSSGKRYRASGKRNLRGKRSFRPASSGQEAATAGVWPSASVSDAGVSVAEVPFLKAFKMDIPAIAGEMSSSESVHVPQTQDRSGPNPPNMVTKTQPESNASEVGLSNPHQTNNHVFILLRRRALGPVQRCKANARRTIWTISFWLVTILFYRLQLHCLSWC